MRIVAMALRDLRVGKLRSVLVATSLIIGVIAIVGVFVAGAFTHDVVIAAAEQQNGRGVTVSTTLQLPATTITDVRRLDDLATQRIANQGGAFAVQASLIGQAGPNHRLVDASFVLTDGNLRGIRRLPVLKGQWPTQGAPYRVAVNKAAAHDIVGVGSVMTVQPTRDQPPVIAVVVAEIADGSTDPIVYGSLSDMLTLRPSAIGPQGLELLVHHPSASAEKLESAADQIVAAANVSDADVQRARRVDTVGPILERLRVTQVAFLSCGIIALVVSALGILNVGMASIRERSRELLIRRAVGATRFELFCLVLGSAICVGLLAGTVAVILCSAAVLGYIPGKLNPELALNAPTLPVTGVIAGLAAAIAASIVGAAAPAVVAARLRVGDALRD